MSPITSLKSLDVDHAEAHVERGAAYVDLRAVMDYLDVHVPGSLALEYEFGPGMAGRARDCIPLHVPFVLLEREGIDMTHVAASFRGKGFAVEGVLEGGLEAWTETRGAPASTEIYEGHDKPEGILVDVGDPGVRVVQDARFVSIEQLWDRSPSLVTGDRLVVLGGRGLRAALAVGMLERAGAADPIFWWTRGRQVGSIPAAGVVKR